VEIEFMTNYFYNQWFSESDKSGDNCFAKLSRMIEMKMDPSASFPIITFNVEGKKISILRSTILRLIPDSLLGIKVSGRWTIQPNEMDEQGNLIVNNCSQKAFDQIITALQFYDHGPAEALRALYFTQQTKNEIETVLDYVQIHFFQALCLE
jgi:hypothetical protein